LLQAPVVTNAFDIFKFMALLTGHMEDRQVAASPKHLSRQLGLLGLAATGICSMLGASIYVVPFKIQHHVPGIGPYVLQAFLVAAVPALLAAIAYAILASAMPRAGGTYIYASRGLSPYLGFVASFSQWFGLSIVIGVVAYVIVPFFRDAASVAGWHSIAAQLERGIVRVPLALSLLWIFIGINIKGIRSYERTLIPLMILMFALGAIVIITGLTAKPADFINAMAEREGRTITLAPPPPFQWSTFASAAALLFASYIGFDSIAQAGGEAKDPHRNLPLAIGIAVSVVGSFYILFTYAVYDAVPWNFIAEEANVKDVTAPGLLTYLLPPFWTVLIITGAAVALTNDLPAMLLSVSRLMFAWAEDKIFPASVAAIHSRYRTPHRALMISGAVASFGVLGSHFAGDFFLGVDIMVIAMLVNFLLMCVSVITLPRVNPAIHQQVRFMPSRAAQLLVAGVGTTVISTFLAVHVWKDLSTSASAWYYHATWVWLLVMALSSLIFWRERNKQLRQSSLWRQQFKKLPDN